MGDERECTGYQNCHSNLKQFQAVSIIKEFTKMNDTESLCSDYAKGRIGLNQH